MSYPWLQGPLTTTAYGWRLERRDGITLGFTSHDRDVSIDGLNYRASPGMAPTSIIETLGLEQGSLEVSGALTSDALRPDDIEAGKWDGAGLTIFLFDWSAPDADPLILAAGTLGGISWSGSAFEVEFLGPASLLGRASVPSTSPTCRVEFAGRGCGLNRRRFVQQVRVTHAAGASLTIDDALHGGPGAFAYGELRWLSGANCGLRQQIVSAGQGVLQLVDAPSFPVSGPERAELLQGCDRTIATCAARFGNAVNFRGEPFLPGNDLLTRYPGAV